MNTQQNAFTIAQFCRRNAVGKTFVYDEIRSGRLQAVKAGRRTLIPATAEQRWLTSLPNLRAAANGEIGSESR